MLQRFFERTAAPTLQVALGLVFLVFGFLKLFPGVSPVEGLVTRTWESLTFGIVGAPWAMVATATLEVFVGLTFVTGVFVRVGLAALAVTFVGIFSPLVFFAGELFTAAGPTLTAQYILKDVVLVGAAMVIAAKALKRSIDR
ncbi:DoxX family protein [Agromyces intestinalis]|uniref:DoxX family protein n=1 Tax=Agromyces intestinalis TaxID=2592652 RepID=A0A5C1YN99_9MICO|nr:DoxX family protein [Agromyces intestinalis]